MKDKLLQATGPELSQLLGEVLQSPPLIHEIRTKWAGDPPMLSPPTVCVKCGLIDPDADGSCSLHAPIPLTPAEAFKWRDWAVKKYGEDAYMVCLYLVWDATIYNVVRDYEPEWVILTLKHETIDAIDYDIQVKFYKWCIAEKQSEHDLQAAALCKEKD